MSYAHMNPSEAIEAYKLLKCKWAISTHHSTFRLADDGYSTPFEDFEAELHKENNSSLNISDHFRHLNVGEHWNIPV